MIGDLFALLTRLRLPGGGMDLQRAARQQQFFPVVGAAVGLSLVLVALVLDNLLPKSYALVSGGVLVALSYYFTGIMHVEGLADFADGIMASGPHERKKEAMKDPHTGVGALVAVALCMILFFAVSSRIFSSRLSTIEPLPTPWGVTVFMGFALAEISGKLAMNTTMYLGPSSHQGMGSLFVNEASGRKMLASILIASAIGALVAGYLFVLVYLGLLAGYLVTLKARQNFGGVAGDAFGASNEIGRLLTLGMWVLFV